MNIKDLKVYCISLERARDRRKQAQNEHEKLGIQFEFIKAIDGRELSEDEIKAYGYDEAVAKRLRNIYKTRGLGRGDIGCALSHLKTYKKMVKNNVSVALISEDDAEFLFDKKDLENILNELPKDWEICLLYHKGNCRKISKNICEFLSPPGILVCYLLNIEGAKKLVELASPLRLASDTLTSRAIYHKIIKGYGVMPTIARPKDGGYSTSSGTLHKKNYLKIFYRFFSNRWVWVRRLKFKLFPNKNSYFTDLY